jgi:hypothetical protein
MKKPEAPKETEDGILPWDYFLEISSIICEVFVRTIHGKGHNLFIARRREAIKTNDDILYNIAWKEKELNEQTCRIKTQELYLAELGVKKELHDKS